jgi:hypothetical protein
MIHISAELTVVKILPLVLKKTISCKFEGGRKEPAFVIIAI